MDLVAAPTCLRLRQCIPQPCDVSPRAFAHIVWEVDCAKNSHFTGSADERGPRRGRAGSPAEHLGWDACPVCKRSARSVSFVLDRSLPHLLSEAKLVRPNFLRCALTADKMSALPGKPVLFRRFQQHSLPRRLCNCSIAKREHARRYGPPVCELIAPVWV